MLKLCNCSLDYAVKNFSSEKIILFGAGSWLKTIDHTKLMDLQEQFQYVIDNNPKEEVVLGNRKLKVLSPNELSKEEKCVVIMTSPIYMYDMYCQLQKEMLQGEIICLAFPFMQMVSIPDNNSKVMNEVFQFGEDVIPKIIHSFWFSKEKKPEIYQKCVNSWEDVLKDYKIIEWNQDNYDCSKHPFIKRAIECEAWAFASDYARLDVLYEYGGIYLDMDVEVFKSFNALLNNKALLSFSNNVQIDLAVIGSMPKNTLIKELLTVYDNIEVPQKREQFAKFFQPSLLRDTLAKKGIKMDGSFQKGVNYTVFPSDVFMPQEHILFRDYEITENTYCNHLDNFGWSFSGMNKREKKINDNRLLWSMIEEHLK